MKDLEFDKKKLAIIVKKNKAMVDIFIIHNQRNAHFFDYLKKILRKNFIRVDSFNHEDPSETEPTLGLNHLSPDLIIYDQSTSQLFPDNEYVSEQGQMIAASVESITDFSLNIDKVLEKIGFSYQKSLKKNI